MTGHTLYQHKIVDDFVRLCRQKPEAFEAAIRKGAPPDAMAVVLCKVLATLQTEMEARNQTTKAVLGLVERFGESLKKVEKPNG